jgi:hypothetical protein
MEAIDVLKYAGLDVKTRQSAMRNPTSVQETCELGP